ncbi:hypothetical protein [Cellulomonas sp. PhB143]|uniref:hypothetical protein n=1 Tax=Cellulomonas sp. PhB143 TaxID=2485186 RepID=UPI000F46E48B|nr:hypothetical protein [Cellulomonas sp. PhB143]ROS77253.1 hypothetical protein EDF32_1251 [Cellulomonas sp. PhB143]
MIPVPGDGGPSPALRRTVTVLVVVLSALLVVSWSVRWVRGEGDRCVAGRPAGVSAEQVASQWRWWPPGYRCVYPDDAGTSV